MKAITPLFFLAFTAAAGVAAPVQDDFSLPPPTDSTNSSLELWATHYFVHGTKEQHSGVPFLDRRGQPLTGKVSPRDWCLGAIEGTVAVASESSTKTINYAGLAGPAQLNCASILKISPSKKPWITSIGRSYFSAAKGPYGDGVKGYILVPYRTIAVDKNKIPFGTVLFIPAAKDAQVFVAPGVTIKHDGYFFAADTGGAIKGNHIDVFCGVSAENCFPSFIASNEAQTFKAIVVTEEAIKTKLSALHRQ